MSRKHGIKKVIQDPKTKAYLMFVIEIISEVFEPFLVQFQAKETLIHILYAKLGDFVFSWLV
jgi:hypothetical protein